MPNQPTLSLMMPLLGSEQVVLSVVISVTGVRRPPKQRREQFFSAHRCTGQKQRLFLTFLCGLAVTGDTWPRLKPCGIRHG